MAITRAPLEWISRFLPEHHPVLLPAGRVIRDVQSLSRACGPDDVLCLVGGGNLGDLYPQLEDARRRCIRAFHATRVISFPQSVHFSATSTGRAELEQSRRAYLSHPRLIVTARDTESLDRLTMMFPGLDVRLAPDLVLGMTVASAAPRTGRPLLCLRQDTESRLLPGERRALEDTLARNFAGLTPIDQMCQTRRGRYAGYLPDLDALLRSIASAPLVVTDRLHGMIFSAVTGTPCVALDNSYGKVSALHRTWLDCCTFVRLAPSAAPETVLHLARHLAGRPGQRPDLTSAFAALADVVRAP